MFRLADLHDRFRIPPGTRVDLDAHDPAWAGDEAVPEARRKGFAKALLEESRDALEEAQELLWAADAWSVLVVLQALDAGGKDSTIEHVFSGVNPQGCRVVGFKKPSAEELDHDFLWRCVRELPRRGQIGIFNRSYYEEVLVVRVHPELLVHQRLPGVGADAGPELWAGRYRSINHFERHLVANGTRVLKFYLHLSREEQRRRFLKRLRREDKQWKFNAADVAERQHWDAYRAAYREALSATSTEHAPWYVIPADHKWMARALVADVLATEIRALGLEWPQVTEEEKGELAEWRRRLEAEGEDDRSG